MVTKKMPMKNMPPGKTPLKTWAPRDDTPPPFVRKKKVTHGRSQ